VAAPGLQTSGAMVSVVTPTYNRPELLRKAYSVFDSQTYAPREWIVIDDSDAPHPFFENLDDPRVKYTYLNERMSTGAKRNLAIEQSSGPLIAQLDDDDYYRPEYLAQMIGRLEKSGADLIKLSAFFVYHVPARKLGYCDLLNKQDNVFEFSPSGPVRFGKLDGESDREDNHLGYGFCYVFRRAIWEREPFEDRYWGQDTPFVKRAIANGFNVGMFADKQGLSLHLIHDSNESKTFAHYLLPDFMLPTFFPRIEPFLKSAD